MLGFLWTGISAAYIMKLQDEIISVYMSKHLFKKSDRIVSF